MTFRAVSILAPSLLVALVAIDARAARLCSDVQADLDADFGWAEQQANDIGYGHASEQFAGAVKDLTGLDCKHGRVAQGRKPRRNRLQGDGLLVGLALLVLLLLHASRERALTRGQQ